MSLSKSSPLFTILSLRLEIIAGTLNIWMWSLHFTILWLLSMMSIWQFPKAGWKASLHLSSLFDYRMHFKASTKHCDYGIMILTPSCFFTSSHYRCAFLTGILAVKVFWYCCMLTTCQCCTWKMQPPLRSKWRPSSQKNSRSPIAAWHASFFASKSTVR